MEDAQTNFVIHLTTLPSCKAALLADSTLAVLRATPYVQCPVLSILILYVINLRCVA